MALFPRLEADEEKALITCGSATEQAEAANRIVVLHALGLRQNPLDLFQDLIGSLQRSRRRKLDIQKCVAVILFGQKARREFSADESIRYREAHENQYAHDRLANQPVA